VEGEWTRRRAAGDARALIDAADEDVGTGGPDLVRGIFPSVKTITRSGFGDCADDEVKRVCEAILADRRAPGTGLSVPLPYYVSPEQMMKDKAEYARKGISRGRSIVTLEVRDGILLVARTPRRCCTRSRRSTTASRSRGSASTTSSKISGSPASATPISRATRTAAAT